MLIGLYNKCKSCENSLITWNLEAPMSTIIKNLIPVWFSTRLTNITHKQDVQEQSTPWAPLEGLKAPYMSKLKIWNHNHISWFYKKELGNTTSRNRDVDSRTVSELRGLLARTSRGWNGNIPWGDPEGCFLSSYLLGELLEGDAHVLQPKLFPDYPLPQKFCGQQEQWWPGRWVLHFLHAGRMDPGLRHHCHKEVTDRASGVQWDVQPLYSVVLIQIQVLFKYGLPSYPKSTLDNMVSAFQLIALKNRVVAVSPTLNK